MFASLAEFQLLIIKRKKRFVNFKTMGIVLTTVTIGTIVIPLIYIGVKDGRAVLCGSTEGCIGVDTSYLLGIFAPFYVTAWIPISLHSGGGGYNLVLCPFQERLCRILMPD